MNIEPRLRLADLYCQKANAEIEEEWEAHNG